MRVRREYPARSSAAAGTASETAAAVGAVARIALRKGPPE